MKTSRYTLYALIVFALTTCFAHAQASRTWVSGVGDDVNPCSRTAPCKTFAGAISKTADGGEIDALDPAGYGALTITKSITIDGGGGQVASVLVTGVNGIVVSAQANDVVILRNLRINGLLGNGSNSANAGINGIRFLSGRMLQIENCDIFGFNNNGIDITHSGNASVFVLNTVTSNNAANGLYAKATSGAVQVAIADSKFVGSGNAGIYAQDSALISVRDSMASGGQFGVLAQAQAAGAQTVVNLFSSTLSNNVTGIMAGGGAGNAGSARVQISAVTTWLSSPNNIVEGAGGTVASFGNNYNPSLSGAPNATLTPQ